MSDLLTQCAAVKTDDPQLEHKLSIHYMVEGQKKKEITSRIAKFFRDFGYILTYNRLYV